MSAEEHEMNLETSPKQSYYQVTPIAGMGTKWKAATVLAIIVAAGALAMGILSFESIARLQEITEELSSESPLEVYYPTSCNSLDKSLRSGLYIIRPTSSMLAFPVYCDLDTNGGGWTLVASVHENNIQGKCTPGDKWSSEQGSEEEKHSPGSLNWENFNIFGRVDAITKSDYKNAAYFAVMARNVMIWHVPNGISTSEISNWAFLKYYTNNSFLEENGGNLRDLYKDFLPLKSFEKTGLTPFLNLLNETTKEILSEVPQWHRYIYDAFDEIADGGNDLFDNGNKVSFRVNKAGAPINIGFVRMTYNSPYILYSMGVEVHSTTTYPFTAVAWISNEATGAEKVYSFEFRVESGFGADNQGRAEMYGNTLLSYGNMTAVYTAFLIHSAEDSSICEVYFYLASKTLWNSTAPEHMDTVNWNLQNTNKATNIVLFAGNPSNVMLGYMLLSRENGAIVTPTQIERVLRRFMTLAETFQYKKRLELLQVPVNYAVGNNSQVRDSIPTDLRNSVDPGYIQFRAINLWSTTNALCPGVRVRGNFSEQVCIGGGNTMKIDPSVCGDFAGWDGYDGTSRNETFPSATGRSQRDINSTILIFTR